MKMITNIKFIGKSKKSRKIKCKVNNQNIVINVIFGKCNINLPYELFSDNDLKELRTLFIENYLWIYGWDEAIDDDFSENALKRQFKLDLKLNKITQDEAEYLIKNLITDYQKHKLEYPTFKEITVDK